MADLLLYLWDLFTAIALFGFGLLGLRLCRIRRAPLAVAGVFGVALWIALGAWLNLLHLLRPTVFLVLNTLGAAVALYELLAARRTPPSHSTPTQPFTLPARLLLGTAIAVIATMAIGGMRPLAWGVDDLQGYASMAVKAAQLHALQPDPFSERRVQAGVGGQNFLDTAMFATGDLRAMPFIDSTFGLCLYALALWAVGRRLRTPPTALALALCCLAFAPLMKWNLTIIYLSAAAFFAVFLLLADADPDTPLPLGRILAIGIITGSICSTKSPNITFLIPFLLIAALIHKLLQPAARSLSAFALSMLAAAAVFLPWAVANKTNAGTYLYPILGQGFHVSAFHFIPVPAKLAPLQLTVVMALPSVVLLALAAVLTFNLTRTWPAQTRAAGIAFLLAALTAVPVICYGLGGQTADRYTAPVLVPALLLSFLLTAALWNSAPRRWRRLALATQLLAAAYLFLFVEPSAGEYTHIADLAHEAAGLPPSPHYWMTPLTAAQLQADFALGAKVQSTVPPGETALAATQPVFFFDFSRNPIDIADCPGMASPPPGLPLTAGPEAQRQFLLRAGIHYLILSTDPAPPDPDWQSFFHFATQRYPWYIFFFHQTYTHRYDAWQITELKVQHHERLVFQQIADHSHQLYNDGHIIVARIN